MIAIAIAIAVVIVIVIVWHVWQLLLRIDSVLIVCRGLCFIAALLSSAEAIKR